LELPTSGCTLCGECCRRRGDYIPLTIFDLVRLHDGLKTMEKGVEFGFRMVYVGSIGELTPRDSSRYRYSLLVDGWVPSPCLDLPCGYLEGNVCSIHGFKPLICTSFPYHLPVWSEDDPCSLIRELASGKGQDRGSLIPVRARSAIKLYNVARSATMYQLNFPIYSPDEGLGRLVQKGGFRDLVENTRMITVKKASRYQVSEWVSKHFTHFHGVDDRLEAMFGKIGSTLFKALEDPDFCHSNMLLMEELSRYHLTSPGEIKVLRDELCYHDPHR